MIIVRVELHSAVTHQVTELARMQIVNTGESSGRLRHYIAQTFIGRSKEQLDRQTVKRNAEIRNWPSEAVHIWNLVANALYTMGYQR